ncbi:MAG TPA: hypothetical protein VG796_25810 [Verrucomicrobiales bacterium]|nr:hypothetical protein [Verrucomicrobiales bacterium]
MTEISIQRQVIRAGPRFGVSFQRTLRIPDDGQTYPLPPGLGSFPVFAVADFKERLPEDWSPEDAFIPVYQREAVWLAFHGTKWKPNAVQVRVGGVSALTGETGDQPLKAEPQNYLVTAAQPWLDGIVSGTGMVRQFVAMPLGLGYTVEAAVTGAERRGAIGLRVYEPKPGIFPDEEPASPEGSPPRAAAGIQPMGLGAGGKMKQKIYRDPHGVEVWDPREFADVTIHLLNSAQFREVTGLEPPGTPVDAAAYAEAGLPWFDLYDEHLAALDPAAVLANAKTIAQRDEERGIDPAQLPEIDVRRLPVKTRATDPGPGGKKQPGAAFPSNPAES